MAQFKRMFTKDLSDCDQTLSVVLKDIEERNAKNAKLVTFSIQPGEVILFYEGHESE